jgi:hypothetical protein
MPVFSLNAPQDCDNCYVFRIRVSAFTSGSITVEIGNDVAGTFTSISTVDTLTANGTYAIDIDPSIYSCNTFNAIRVTLSSPTTALYQVLGFFVAETCAPKLCSRCFEVVESAPCVLELSWTNGRNLAELEYSNLNFTQRAWVKGELANAVYPIENNVFRYGNGDTLLTFARRVKTMQLGIKDIPEFLHNAISLGLMHDEFYINGEQYRLAGDSYEPIWRRTAKVAPVIVDVYKKQENSRNQLC